MPAKTSDILKKTTAVKSATKPKAKKGKANAPSARGRKARKPAIDATKVPAGTPFSDLPVGAEFRWRDAVLLGLDEVSAKSGQGLSRRLQPAGAEPFDVRLPDESWLTVPVETFAQASGVA